jgi:hypothetical protein
VVSAQAIEAVGATGEPARFVALYVADSTGVSNDALAAQVVAALLDFRAGGITTRVYSSIPVIQSVTLQLVFETNVDTGTLSEQVRAAVVGFVNSLPVNGALTTGDLYGVLRRFAQDGLVVAGVPGGGDYSVIVAPAGDVVPGIGQTLRATPSSVQLSP